MQCGPVVRATVKVNERPPFWPLTARKPLNRFRKKKFETDDYITSYAKFCYCTFSV